MKRADENDYEVLARRAGFTWLGPLPDNMLEKTNWRCAHGQLQPRERCLYGHHLRWPWSPLTAVGAGAAVALTTRFSQAARYSWVGSVGPPNTRTLTTWRFPDGPQFGYVYRSIAARSSRIADTGLRSEPAILREALVDGVV